MKLSCFYPTAILLSCLALHSHAVITMDMNSTMPPYNDDSIMNPDFPDDDEIINAQPEENANIEIEFIPGTAFTGWVVLRDGNTGELRNVGKAGVGFKLAMQMPVGTSIKIGVSGFFGKYCRYFTVTEPGEARIALWGAADYSKYVFSGNALEFSGREYRVRNCRNP